MQYSREERHALEEAVRTGKLECPACGGRLTAQDVPPPPGVSYVRQRVWLVCVACKRSAAVDRR